MIWRMRTSTFTLVHVLLSLIGIGSGLIVMFGLLVGKLLSRWRTLFLVTTVTTSVTGAVAIVARYGLHLGGWRIYVVCAAVALYLNVLVGVVQAFLKVPALTAMAPEQTEPPVVLTQLVVLALFIALTLVAVKKARG